MNIVIGFRPEDIRFVMQAAAGKGLKSPDKEEFIAKWLNNEMALRLEKGLRQTHHSSVNLITDMDAVDDHR